MESKPRLLVECQFRMGLPGISRIAFATRDLVQADWEPGKHL